MRSLDVDDGELPFQKDSLTWNMEDKSEMNPTESHFSHQTLSGLRESNKK